MGNGVYARFAALWFGLQFVWGAILAISLQARSVALAPHDGLRAYRLITASSALLGMLAQLASGPLADRTYDRCGDRRAFYAGGIALAVPALFWFYLTLSYAQLVAFFLLQLGMNVVTGPYAAIVPDYVPSERAGAASAWMGTSQSLGNAGGLLIAGFVNDPAVVASVLCAVLGTSWLVTSRRRWAFAPIAQRANRFVSDTIFARSWRPGARLISAFIHCSVFCFSTSRKACTHPPLRSARGRRCCF